MLKFLITIILLLNETKEKTRSRYKLLARTTSFTRNGIYFISTLTAASLRYNDQYYEYVNTCLIYFININK